MWLPAEHVPSHEFGRQLFFAAEGFLLSLVPHVGKSDGPLGLPYGGWNDSQVLRRSNLIRKPEPGWESPKSKLWWNEKPPFHFESSV